MRDTENKDGLSPVAISSIQIITTLLDKGNVSHIRETLMGLFYDWVIYNDNPLKEPQRRKLVDNFNIVIDLLMDIEEIEEAHKAAFLYPPQTQ